MLSHLTLPFDAAMNEYSYIIIITYIIIYYYHHLVRDLTLDEMRNLVLTGFKTDMR